MFLCDQASSILTVSALLALTTFLCGRYWILLRIRLHLHAQSVHLGTCIHMGGNLSSNVGGGGGGGLRHFFPSSKGLGQFSRHRVRVFSYITNLSDKQANKHTKKVLFRDPKIVGGGGDMLCYVPHLPNRGGGGGGTLRCAMQPNSNGQNVCVLGRWVCFAWWQCADTEGKPVVNAIGYRSMSTLGGKMFIFHVAPLVALWVVNPAYCR